jgi:hypothetical protein
MSKRALVIVGGSAGGLGVTSAALAAVRFRDYLSESRYSLPPGCISNRQSSITIVMRELFQIK